jgi:hypothetical protein
MIDDLKSLSAGEENIQATTTTLEAFHTMQWPFQIFEEELCYGNWFILFAYFMKMRHFVWSLIGRHLWEMSLAIYLLPIVCISFI